MSQVTLDRKSRDRSPQTDLEVSFQGNVFLHVANINHADGAAAQSLSFLVGGTSSLIYNVAEGGEIDTTGLYDFDDLWDTDDGDALLDAIGMSEEDFDDGGDEEDGCGCTWREYLVGGDGAQTIRGGDVGFAVLVGGAGDDSLRSEATTALYVGGPGSDAIELGSGGGIVFFEADAERNGIDVIQGFKAGAAGDYVDVLSFIDFRLGLSYMDFLGSGTVIEDMDTAPPVLVRDFGKRVLEFADFAGEGVEKAVAVNLVGAGSADVWFLDAGEVLQVATLTYSGEISQENFLIGHGVIIGL